MPMTIDLDTLDVAAFIVDVEPGLSFRINGMNAVAERETGLSRDRLVGRLFEECLPDDIARMLTARYSRCAMTRQPLQFEEQGELSPSGGWFRTTLSPHVDPLTGEIVRIVAISQNITASKRLQIELRKAAFTDTLTGLLNRRGFDQAVGDMCDQAHYTNEGFSIVVVDMDGLKSINDAYGHRQGDAAIRIVGAWLAGFLRHGEDVARVGGDEFYMLFHEPTRADLDRRLAFLASLTNDGLDVPGLPAAVGISAGGAVWQLGEDAYEVLSRADAEMYARKAVRKLRSVSDVPSIDVRLPEGRLSAVRPEARIGR